MRIRWVPAFYKEIFTERVLTTQPSESLNAYYDGYASKKNSLMDFFVRFTRAVK